MNHHLQAESFRVADLPHVHGGPVASGVIRTALEDFYVEESLPFELSGEGEHLYLFVEKRALNSGDAARQLAQIAGIRRRMVSMAGLKDRHAVTRQWFSLHLPGLPDPDFSGLPPDMRILDQRRHSRKLRRGAIRQNRFRLQVRAVEGDAPQLAERLQQVAELGFPNYFGEQRFGRGHANLKRAIAVLERGATGSPVEGLYLSAVRSMLFNRVLAARISDGSWCSAKPGDVMQLSGSNSLFRADKTDGEISRRLADQQIHVTGPLVGIPARIMPQSDALCYEDSILKAHRFWSGGLQRCGVKADRRPLRAVARDLEFNLDGERLQLAFTLQRGSYATALLREVLTTSPSAQEL
ncbi:MAG: tRNA pseudouridine(13) synthase TruD [Pseudomonadota bacterium]